MSDTITGHQLYSPERLKGMDRRDLNQVERFARADAAETSNTLYDGMNRADTIATAKRTRQDITAEFGRRAVAAMNRVHDVEQAHELALLDYTQTIRRP